MCGFTGFITNNTNLLQIAELIANKMAKTIEHRGPNDSGVWIDHNSGVVLAHRRLSIVDLSPAGHQPMTSKSGRFILVFNGEIYNHLELRGELDAISSLGTGIKDKDWKGYSDTETLLAGFEKWGIEATLQKTVGMFAFSLWDKNEKLLTLARDRFGEKPLYYGFQNNSFLFGSELKALKVHPDFANEIDRDSLCLLMRYCYIPAPYSIYKGIKKLLPGTYIQINLDNANNTKSQIPKPYWRMEEVAAKGLANPFDGSDTEAIRELDSQLKKSIGLQMTADVPLGAFLSGGVDSSAIVALMQSQSTKPVKTFSIGFDEVGYNEAKYAEAVAMHLGTEHTELYVSSSDAINVIPMLPKIYDEPFADSSQIPTYLVSKMAKHHVTVALSGDAGDELFCGYNRYLLGDTWRKIQHIPFFLRKNVGHLISTLNPTTWDYIFGNVKKINEIPNNMGQKIEKLAERLQKVDEINSLYYSLISETDQPEQIVLGAREPETWLTKVGVNQSYHDVKQHMMFLDTMTYLSDDILVKVDRAAMANSLETRVPFLDHRVVELAWKLPIDMKIREGKTKWILREVLYQYIPKHLIDRPKAGFGIPLAEWLRGPLRGWAEELLNEKRLTKEGFLNVKHVISIWNAHLSGRSNHQSLLWNILMFQAWLEIN
jgi:asparagine synthase (glutamine-hydrolysing)